MFTSREGISSRPQNSEPRFYSGDENSADTMRKSDAVESDNYQERIGRAVISGDVENTDELVDIVPQAPERDLREVVITPLNSGYMVKVGCQTVAVETNETLLAALAKYVNDPTEFEKNWYSNQKRNKLENIL